MTRTMFEAQLKENIKTGLCFQCLLYLIKGKALDVIRAIHSCSTPVIFIQKKKEFAINNDDNNVLKVPVVLLIR